MKYTFLSLALWPQDGENKYCTGHQLANSDDVENQKSCQNQCELVDECVGITYSNKPGNTKYCYICLNDELRDASNGFNFYRRQGKTSSFQKQIRENVISYFIMV